MLLLDLVLTGLMARRTFQLSIQLKCVLLVFKIFFSIIFIFITRFIFIGTYGFVLPADQIIPNSLEILDGILALVDEARTLGQL